MTHYDTFGTLLDKLSGMENKSITITKTDVVEGDNFLIFSAYDSITITFKRRYDGIWVVCFNNDESILLEDCPMSFYLTLLKNLP
jgi:hypothetical protein